MTTTNKSLATPEEIEAIKARRANADRQRFTASHSNYPTWGDIDILLDTVEAQRAEIERLLSIVNGVSSTLPEHECTIHDLDEFCGKCVANVYQDNNRLIGEIIALQASGAEKSKRIEQLSHRVSELAAQKGDWEAQALRNAAELAALRATREWQPIENAPKDGTEMWLWPVSLHGRYFQFKGRWDDDPEDSGGQCWRLTDADGGDWINPDPTHFLLLSALPDPPQS